MLKTIILFSLLGAVTAIWIAVSYMSIKGIYQQRYSNFNELIYDKKNKTYKSFDSQNYIAIQQMSDFKFILTCLGLTIWPIFLPYYHFIYLPYKKHLKQKSI